MRRLALIAAAWMVGAAPALSHEFWISPERYEIAPGEALEAHLRVGQDFKGSVYAYIPDNFRRFDLALPSGTAPVEGRIGDRPALNRVVDEEGLAVVVHVTKDFRLTYSEREKFVDFVTHKDFAEVLEQHAARGLPETGFREAYSRHGKSLIAVGSGAGADEVFGLDIEVVALANPYTDDLSKGFPVQILYQGVPRADEQVELFDKAPDDTVTVTQFRTDADGKVTLPVLPGHEYLVDSVVMRPMDPPGEHGEVWESLWGSLTFKVPSD